MTIRGRRGEPGEQGDPGERGKRGDHGSPGHKGEPGATADKGDKGLKGDKGEVSTELREDVRTLNETVSGLVALMSRFPDREEVKREGRARMWKALIFGITLILIAQFLTLGTVSYCFLTPQPGEPHRVFCSSIPGYDRAIDDGNARLARFKLLLSEIEFNDRRIEKLQVETELLKKQLEEEQIP